MRERVHEEGGAVEHGHEGHSAAGAVVRGGGELGSGRGRRRGGGRSGWGGGSVDRGRWGGEDKHVFTHEKGLRSTKRSSLRGRTNVCCESAKWALARRGPRSQICYGFLLLFFFKAVKVAATPYGFILYTGSLRL